MPCCAGTFGHTILPGDCATLRKNLASLNFAGFLTIKTIYEEQLCINSGYAEFFAVRH